MVCGPWSSPLLAGFSHSSTIKSTVVCGSAWGWCVGPVNAAQIRPVLPGVSLDQPAIQDWDTP
jgi:hypothetical protein